MPTLMIWNQISLSRGKDVRVFISLEIPTLGA
jgi:hypothetical protein